MDAVQIIKEKIQEKNISIDVVQKQLNDVRNENMKLVEQKKLLDQMNSQLKLAEERESVLMAESEKVRQANEALKRELENSVYQKAGAKK